MTKITRKEIRGTVEEALKQSLSKYDMTSTPKKADKIVKKFAKKMANVVKGSLAKKKAGAKDNQKAKTKSPLIVA